MHGRLYEALELKRRMLKLKRVVESANKRLTRVFSIQS